LSFALSYLNHPTDTVPPRRYWKANLIISLNKHAARSVIISSSDIYCKHVDAREIQYCLLGGSRFEVRKRTRCAKQTVQAPCPAASWIISFPSGSVLFLFFFLLSTTSATPSPTLQHHPARTPSATTTQQQNDNSDYYDIMACCGLFSGLSDFARNLFKREPAEVPKRYSYAESGWPSHDDVTEVRVRRPLSPRKSGGRIPSVPFMNTQPGPLPTHVETIHGRTTPPTWMEESRWYGTGA
jgi:hypothetical protein